MPDNALRIRHGQLADAAVLAWFGERCFRAAFAADNTPEDMEAYVAQAFNAETFGAELADPAAIFLLAYRGEQLAAYAKLHAGGSPDCVIAKNPVELVRLYVDPERTSGGHGSLLMDEAISEGRERGHDVMWLGVWERNDAARRFYERRGFAEKGSHDFVLGSDRQRDVIMTLQLG